MSVTIEVFKQAFAGTSPTVSPTNDDSRALDALKRLKTLVAGLSASDSERFQRVLVDLVTRYQAAKSGTAGQASGAVAEVLRNTQAVIARAEAARPAGNASAELAPAPVGQAAAERKDLPSVPAGDVASRIPLQFNVQHDGDMIENARVRIADQERVTDNRGMAEFALEPGDHAYHVVADGYAELSGTVEVSAAADVEPHGVLLTPLDPDRADVVIRVLNAQTRQTVSSALVRLGNFLEETNNNGEARFVGVARVRDPYLGSIQLRGFQMHTFAFDHNGSDDPAVRVVELEPNGEPTTGDGQPESPPAGDGPYEQVTLQLRVQGERRWIEGATVRIASDERVTDGRGMVEFRLAPGIYSYAVSAESYAELTGRVEVSAAAAIERHAVDLNPLNVERTQVVVRVMDARTRLPIDEAFVTFGSDVDRTSSTGEVRFIGVPRGDAFLRYEVRANGYAPVSDSFQNNREDNPASLTVELQPASSGSPNGPTGEPNVPVGGPSVPGGGAVRNPLQDRTLRRRLAVPADFAAFRAAVVDWIGTVVVAERAGPLVDASNLRELHPNLSGSAGQEKEITAELCADGGWRYEHVYFRVPGVRRAAPAADAPVGQVPPANAPTASIGGPPPGPTGAGPNQGRLEELRTELRRLKEQVNAQHHRFIQATASAQIQIERQRFLDSHWVTIVERYLEAFPRVVQPGRPVPVDTSGVPNPAGVQNPAELQDRARNELNELNGLAKQVEAAQYRLRTLSTELGVPYQETP